MIWAEFTPVNRKPGVINGSSKGENRKGVAKKSTDGSRQRSKEAPRCLQRVASPADRRTTGQKTLEELPNHGPPWCLHEARETINTSKMVGSSSWARTALAATRPSRPGKRRAATMIRDVSACNTYNYGDAFYWDTRYEQEANFDWYQRYSALRPFIRKYISPSSRVLMVGCGNAAISEDMVKDGFEDIMNIDISSVAIEMMRNKHEHIPQLKCILAEMSIYAVEFSRAHLVLFLYPDMQMDVRDMSFFPDDSFDSIIDKVWYRCSNQCFSNVGGSKQITYGDPSARMPHINRNVYNWKIELYILPIPGFKRPAGSTSLKSLMEPVPITDEGLLPADYVIEDPDSHFIYVCKKINEPTDFDDTTSILLPDDAIQR
ncbi:S-adenosyl-L-methionine-dependentmethyltransferases superfamily protein [Striga asiatica]|uniref:S-adenosyl-L-methionine-dependentmethyltransferases superfamily protein n=1 Tax=Striga asiatica TaxID=4170 RepID=A0A5A7QGP6_STRAF|nr:S-adenosyl-L-methionine-dependentmethyltransferases superfamily protein [Striga asiatica]